MTKKTNNGVDKTLRRLSLDRETPKSAFILILLLYGIATFLTRSSSNTQAEITLFGETMRFSALTGVFSMLGSTCIIVLVMLFRAADVRLDLIHQAVSAMTDEDFSEIGLADVTKDAWYADAVYCAWGLGVTNGVDAAHFGVGQPITREQMATLAERFMEVRLHVALKAAKNPTAAFSDAEQVSAWAKESVEAMRVAGILQGDDQNYVNPKAHATRAEATALILRLADATERVSFVPEGTAWIRILNAVNPEAHKPRVIDIKDPNEVKSMIRHLDNMPISGESIKPGSGGFAYIIQFYDQNDQPLMECQFASNFIIVNASVLSTVLPYYLPWTLMQ